MVDLWRKLTMVEILFTTGKNQWWHQYQIVLQACLNLIHSKAIRNKCMKNGNISNNIKIRKNRIINHLGSFWSLQVNQRAFKVYSRGRKLILFWSQSKKIIESCSRFIQTQNLGERMTMISQFTKKQQKRVIMRWKKTEFIIQDLKTISNKNR